MKESYRIDELASRWDVNERTVRREIKRGKLEAFRVGCAWRVRHGEVERYEKESSSLRNRATRR